MLSTTPRTFDKSSFESAIAAEMKESSGMKSQVRRVEDNTRHSHRFAKRLRPKGKMLRELSVSFSEQILDLPYFVEFIDQVQLQVSMLQDSVHTLFNL